LYNAFYFSIKKIVPYNPNIHHRRSIRLKGYDYSASGLYFITICIKDRKCLFGNISNSKMILNDFGIVAHNHWQKLSERFINITLDVFQIMPNHMHGILIINPPVRAGLAPAPTVGTIVGAYKSLVANQCLDIFKQKKLDVMMGKLWQRGYYEHIIRDERAYLRIAEYIVNNPGNWKGDGFYNYRTKI